MHAATSVPATVGSMRIVAMAHEHRGAAELAASSSSASRFSSSSPARATAVVLVEEADDADEDEDDEDDDEAVAAMAAPPASTTSSIASHLLFDVLRVVRFGVRHRSQVEYIASRRTLRVHDVQRRKFAASLLTASGLTRVLDADALFCSARAVKCRSAATKL